MSYSIVKRLADGCRCVLFLWFSSYLSNQYQRINIYGSRSCPKNIQFGVPQQSLSRVITNHNINHHLYADDTQLYKSLSPTDTHTSISTVNDCVIDVLSCMESSKLKLNVDKTDIITIGKKQQLRNKTVDYLTVKILRNNDSSPSETAQNSGVVFDINFSFH